MPGDFTKADLGLSAEALQALRDHVTLVIHAGADIGFDKSKAELDKTNVIGTRNMIALAQSLPRLRRFLHISTAYVAGRKHGHVDYLINNAPPLLKGIGECSYEDFVQAQLVGVAAPYYLTRLFVPCFVQGAAVVNISSSRDRMSQPQTESYTAAKGGISALTHAMAVSLAGKPEDIAEMVLFLCSEKAGFITGENICIDGGMTRLMIYHGDHGWELHGD